MRRASARERRSSASRSCTTNAGRHAHDRHRRRPHRLSSRPATRSRPPRRIRPPATRPSSRRASLLTDTPQTSPFVVNTNADHGDGTLHGDRLHAARGDQRRERSAGQRDPLRPPGRPDDDQPRVEPADDHRGDDDRRDDAARLFAGTPLVTLDGGSDVRAAAHRLLPHRRRQHDPRLRRSPASEPTTGSTSTSANGNTIAGNYIGIDVGGINSAERRRDPARPEQRRQHDRRHRPERPERHLRERRYGIHLRTASGGTPDNNTIAGQLHRPEAGRHRHAGVSGNVSGGIDVDGRPTTRSAARRRLRATTSRANDDNGIRSSARATS